MLRAQAFRHIRRLLVRTPDVPNRPHGKHRIWHDPIVTRRVAASCGPGLAGMGTHDVHAERRESAEGGFDT
jgi:hypothetical protein